MRPLIILIIYTFLVGCGPQYVEVKPGADAVAVVENINEEKCELKGTNTVRITGYAERLPEYIERDLLQLSKNAALIWVPIPSKCQNSLKKVEGLNRQHLKLTCVINRFSKIMFLMQQIIRNTR